MKGEGKGEGGGRREIRVLLHSPMWSYFVPWEL